MPDKKNLKKILADRIRDHKKLNSNESLSAIVEILEKVDPEGFRKLKKSQCAYEYSMIVEYLIEENT